MSATNELTEKLLSEALDLVVRARQLDAVVRREATLRLSAAPAEWLDSGGFDRHVERHNITTPHAPIEPRSLTLPVWVTDQYDRDLFEWEGRARSHLMKLNWTPAK